MGAILLQRHTRYRELHQPLRRSVLRCRALSNRGNRAGVRRVSDGASIFSKPGADDNEQSYCSLPRGVDLQSAEAEQGDRIDLLEGHRGDHR